MAERGRAGVDDIFKSRQPGGIFGLARRFNEGDGGRGRPRRRVPPRSLAALGRPAAPGEIGGAGSVSLFDVGAPGGLQQRLGG